MAGPVATNEDHVTHARFLISASKSIINSCNALRHHFNDLRSNIMRIRNMRLQKEKESSSCKHCATPWTDGSFSFKVNPSPKKGKQKRSIKRKMIRKKKSEQTALKHLGNTAVVKCHVCQKCTKFSMMKIRQEKVEEPVALSPPEKDVRKRKRKKKRDTCHGLNANVVAMARSSLKGKVSEKHSTNLPVSSNDTDIECIGESNPSIKTIHSKKKRKLNDMANSAELNTERMKLKDRRKGPQIKANPLPITPLGLSRTSLSASTNSNLGFISLDTRDVTHNESVSNTKENLKKCHPSPKTIKKSNLNGNKRNLNGNNKKDQYINPFSNTVQQGIRKNKNFKKLNSLKMLIAAEENKSTKGISLTDFLSTV